MLWVGDGLLAEVFAAWQSLTSGASHSDFHASDVLVNSYTLQPMAAAMVANCEASNGADSGDAGTPCPPVKRSVPLWWEDNTFHQLHQLKWTTAFESQAATLKTLVLGVGREWWRNYAYPSAVNGCQTSGGVAHAFSPLQALGPTVRWDVIMKACDVFSVKYAAMTQQVAAYLSSVSLFTGNVIIITSPEGIKECSTVSAPNGQTSTASAEELNIKKAAFWYDRNPHAALDEGLPGFEHRFSSLKRAELAWVSAFAKHARRLKVSVLNISAMGDARGDARVPDGSCTRFCFPGPPHHYAEMMLRMIEQITFGMTDGLY